MEILKINLMYIATSSGQSPIGFGYFCDRLVMKGESISREGI